MTLSTSDISALADQIVIRQLRFASPVLNADEAMHLVGKHSSSSLHRWLTKWKVPPCDDGRYSRRELDTGLKREARARHTRKTRTTAN